MPYRDDDGNLYTDDGILLTQVEEEPPAPAAKDQPGWRKALEDRARKADDLAKENAFLKAGIDVDDPKFKWFAKGYDGEVTVEAIKAAATESKLLDTSEAPEDVIPQAEKDATARIAATSAGASAPGAHGIDEQIAEATKAGNHLRAIALKQQKFHQAAAKT